MGINLNSLIMQWEHERNMHVIGMDRCRVGEYRFALYDAASHRLTHVIRKADVTDLSDCEYYYVVGLRMFSNNIFAIFLFQGNYNHRSSWLTSDRFLNFWRLSSIIYCEMDFFSFSVVHCLSCTGHIYIRLRHISTHIYVPFLANCPERILRENFTDSI